MQREKTDAPRLGRKAKLEEIGRLVVDALMAGAENPCEGIPDLLGGDGLDDAIVLVRAKLRSRAAKAEKGVQMP